MTRYYKVECPRCQGSGVIQYHLVLERQCPLCRGEGLVIDYKHPVEMMPQPEMEMTVVRPKTTAELLADTVPLGKKTNTALLTLRRSARRHRPSTAEMLGDEYAPVAGGRFDEDEDEHNDSKRKFVQGAEPERKDFSGRMRQR